jgi:hypothetical protein
MLNILKNITSLIKKKPFFTFVVVCLLILMCINSNCLQIIEGKRGRRINNIKTINNFRRIIKNNTSRIKTLEDTINPTDSIDSEL